MAVLMTRIAFIHTVAGLTEKFRALANTSLAGMDVFRLLDESLLQEKATGTTHSCRTPHSILRRVPT